MTRPRVRTPRQTHSPLGIGRQKTNALQKILMIVLALLVIWLTAGPFGLWRLHRLKVQRDVLMAQQIKAAKRIEELKRTISRLNEDQGLQERLVRRELGWVRDNEILYVFHREK